MKRMVWIMAACLGFAIILGLSAPAVAADEAQEAVEVVKSPISGIDTMWVLVAAFMVFFMQAGFGMVRRGSSAPRMRATF
jgi:Amt family ammonium transporter